MKLFHPVACPAPALTLPLARMEQGWLPGQGHQDPKGRRQFTSSSGSVSGSTWAREPHGVYSALGADSSLLPRLQNPGLVGSSPFLLVFKEAGWPRVTGGSAGPGSAGEAEPGLLSVSGVPICGCESSHKRAALIGHPRLLGAAAAVKAPSRLRGTRGSGAD